MNAILLSLSLIFYSVANFSIKATGVAYLLLAIYILKSYQLRTTFSLKFIIFSLGLLIFFTVSFLIQSPMDRAIYLLKLFLLFPYVVVFSLLRLNDLIDKKLFDKVVTFYLIIASSIFIIQFVVYVSFDYYLDFNDILREKESRTAYMSRDLLSFIPIRATGLFSEPSFYAMSVLPGIVYGLLNKINFKVIVLSMITCVLSFSAAAIIVSILLVFYYSMFYAKKIKYKILTLIIVFSMALVGGGFIYKRMYDSNDYVSDGSGLLSRFRVFNEMNVWDWQKYFVGDGMFVNELSGNGATGLSAAAIRDTGLHVSLLYQSGIIGLCLFIFISYFSVSNVKNYLFISILLLMKYSFIFSLFWVLFIMLLIPIKRDENGN